MTIKTRELLESLLAGHGMTPRALDAWLGEQVTEDLYLEYKHGLWLVDKKQAPGKIRKYLSGFANSAGGTLVVGVDEKTWAVTDCSAPGGGDLAEWAARCVNPIAPHFSLPPRFQVVAHPAGNVLVASADRSLSLVPCIEEGSELVYYFRFHDQTLKAPDYLISDLVLRRRQHPRLRITDYKLKHFSRAEKTKPGCEVDLKFQPSFTIANEGLSWADDVKLGSISWNKHRQTQYSDYLLRHVHVRQPTVHGYSKRCVVSHFLSDTRRGQVMEPFMSKVISFTEPHIIPIRRMDDWHIPYRWRAAVYVLPKGSPPDWYQLELRVDSSVVEWAKSHQTLPSDSDFLSLEPMSGERPFVAWDSDANL
jgi:hypothetical protein